MPAFITEYPQFFTARTNTNHGVNIHQPYFIIQELMIGDFLRITGTNERPMVGGGQTPTTA